MPQPPTCAPPSAAHCAAHSAAHCAAPSGPTPATPPLGPQALWFMLALRQFFVLDLRRDGLRLLLDGGLFAVLKWQATALYARAVVELVLRQMGM